MPRDEFGNIREIYDFTLQDTLSVRLEGVRQDQNWSGHLPMRDCNGEEMTRWHPLYSFPKLQFEGAEDSLEASFNIASISSVGTNSKGVTNSTALRLSWDADGRVPDGWDRQGEFPPHFNTQFLLTSKGVYRLTVTLEDLKDNHALEGGSISAFGVAEQGLSGVHFSSPFEITVIPAALDVSYTLNHTYEIAADREDGLAVAFAGEENLWQFVARDAFGNIRLDNDTMFVDIVEVQKVNASKVYPAPAFNHSWNSTCECYDVTFSTEKSMRWDDRNFFYDVTVKLGQKCTAQPWSDDESKASHCGTIEPVAVPRVCVPSADAAVTPKLGDVRAWATVC